MSEEVQNEQQPTAEGSQQQLQDEPRDVPEAPGTTGGSDADVSRGPSKPGSQQAIDDSKPQSSGDRNTAKDKDKDNDGRSYWELGRGIVFFCIGSFITCTLTGIVLVK